MKNKGFVKLYRGLIETDEWKLLTSKQQIVFIVLLLMANHKRRKWEWKGRLFECQPGQLITSLKSIESKSPKDISTKNIRTAIDKLKRLKFLTNESTKTGRLITILNWEKYQSVPKQTGKELGKETGRQPATNKNYKDIKKNREKGSTIDSNFLHTPDLEEWAKEEGFNGSLSSVTNKFKDWHISKGTFSKDWNAEWRNWIRREIEHELKSKAKGKASTDQNNAGGQYKEFVPEKYTEKDWKESEKARKQI